MKRFILPVALSALVLGSGYTISQAAQAGAPAAAAKQQKLVPVATIRGAQNVRDFQRNVQVMQAERQIAIDLKTEFDKETNAKKKKDLQTKLDAAVKKLNDDNATMAKTYGFSLARNYTMEIEAASIYLEVTDEEAAKIEQAQKAEEAKKGKK